jgi:hypothetical protein
MRGTDHLRRARIVTALCAVILAAFGSVAFAADPPAKAVVTVAGTPAPGSTITATAALTISDGSTLQSVAWKQIGGVPVTLTGANTATVTIALPDRKTFRHKLMEILEEPPINTALYPAYVPSRVPYEGGLQDLFTVAAVSPHAYVDASSIAFELTVVTSSGSYKLPASVSAKLPWPHSATGLRNVAVGVPVLMHGKTQATYNWTLNKPVGSTAALLDATSQDPEFTPDVAGAYELTITDLATNKPVTIALHAGTWQGIVRGADEAGRPLVSFNCTSCHTRTGPLDMFTPWAKSGHAEIFTQNVATPNGHYTEACLSCHTVGYDLDAKNNGVDEQANFATFAKSDVLTHGDPLNWKKIIAEYPAVAQMANIQCENCHGPQNSAAHMKADNSRISLSSDLCGSCHGEPLRHGRFQQWQLSRHSNYELAREEGTNASCAKCHSGNGFLQWQQNGFSSAPLKIEWTTEEVHPVTCAACHDPHDVGTTSGNASTNARVRVAGKTPKLDAGFEAQNVGTAATCMICHNGRRGLRNDKTFTVADSTRAPHLGPQTDMLMGENMYFVATGERGFHSMIEDSCVTCHMESTAPVASLSMNGGGTNHAFYASKDICKKCHTKITADSVQKPVEEKMEALKVKIETAIKLSLQNQLRLGNAIDIGGVKTVRSASDIKSVELIESHGRQGIATTLGDGTIINDISLQAVKVVRPGGAAVEIYSVTDPAVAKAGWNYFMVHADKSHGVHNPTFTLSALDVALFAVTNTIGNATSPSGYVAPELGGGVGNFQGAVGCTTPYVYWAEIAGHIPGNGGSDWRTDLVARNLGSSNASIRFILHQTDGKLEGTGSVAGAAQKGFEDVVAMLGGQNNKGALEICSDQPLLVAGRIFNRDATGTFGQNIDGHVADRGYSSGQTVSLIGLRQKSGLWRTNLSVTNAGTTSAEVLVTLFDASGNSVKSYNLTVPAGQVVQDVEPFKNRANLPDLDWGFATVTVVKGVNVRTMASLIDNKTNDPTTIPAKQ